MPCVIAPETVWMTYSPVSWMLRRVSLKEPSPLVQGEKHTLTGLEPAPMKKEKGARLGTPSTDSVETKAMGRGATAWMSRS